MAVSVEFTSNLCFEWKRIAFVIDKKPLNNLVRRTVSTRNLRERDGDESPKYASYLKSVIDHFLYEHTFIQFA